MLRRFAKWSWLLLAGLGLFSACVGVPAIREPAPSERPAPQALEPASKASPPPAVEPAAALTLSQLRFAVSLEWEGVAPESPLRLVAAAILQEWLKSAEGPEARASLELKLRLSVASNAVGSRHYAQSRVEARLGGLDGRGQPWGELALEGPQRMSSVNRLDAEAGALQGALLLALAQARELAKQGLAAKSKGA